MKTSNSTQPNTDFPYTREETRVLQQQWWNRFNTGELVDLNSVLKLPEDVYERFLAGRFQYADESA